MNGVTKLLILSGLCFAVSALCWLGYNPDYHTEIINGVDELTIDIYDREASVNYTKYDGVKTVEYSNGTLTLQLVGDEHSSTLAIGAIVLGIAGVSLIIAIVPYHWGPTNRAGDINGRR